MADLKLFHVQLTVFCSSCMNFEYLYSRTAADAIKEARQNGWMLRNKKDWICPACNGRDPSYEGDH